MSQVASLAIYFVAFITAWEIVSMARTRGRRYRITLSLVRGLSRRHLLAPLLAFGVGLIGYNAHQMLPPGWDWGWWSAMGGRGSVALGTLQDSTSIAPALRFLMPAMPLLILCIVPIASRIEESYFRRGLQRHGWPRRIAGQAAFGAMHMIMGVPVSAAIAISFAGGAFALAYGHAFMRTGSQGLATIESTRWHIAYNFSVIAIIVLYLVVRAIKAMS